MNSDSGVSLGQIYAFLALSMRYPEPSWLNQGYVSNLLALLSETGHAHAASLLEKSLAEDEKGVEALQVEHTRLFVNAHPACPAPPFGSVYLESDRSLQGTTTEKVRDFYRENGFDIADQSIIPDEITIELEFLGRLVDQGLLDRESEFLTLYFRPWFLVFKEIVHKEARHPFYPALVELIDFFTSQEEEKYGP